MRGLYLSDYLWLGRSQGSGKMISASHPDRLDWRPRPTRPKFFSSNYWGKILAVFIESMISANIFSLIITRDSRSTVVVSGGCGEASSSFHHHRHRHHHHRRQVRRHRYLLSLFSYIPNSASLHTIEQSNSPHPLSSSPLIPSSHINKT